MVIVNWNTRELLRACLRSVELHPPSVSFEVWVVDNASSDGSADMVAAEFPGVVLVRSSTNDGFSAANNRAIRGTRARFVLLLNSDAEVLPGALERAYHRAVESGNVIAARLRGADGRLQHSTFRFPAPLVDFVEALYLHRLLPKGIRGRWLLGGYWEHDSPRIVGWALGAFLLVPREAVEAAGALPEEYFLFGEDMEWCYRLHRAGFPVEFRPDVEILHHGNESAGQLPPEWRIRRTHEAKWDFLRLHFGSRRAAVLRWVHLLGYRVRVALFRTLPGRKADAEYYEGLLRAVCARTGTQ